MRHLPKSFFVLSAIALFFFVADSVIASPQFKGQGRSGFSFSEGIAPTQRGANRGGGARANPGARNPGGGASRNRGNYNGNHNSHYGHNHHSHRGHGHSSYRPSYNSGRNSLSLNRNGISYGYLGRGGTGLSITFPFNNGFGSGYGYSPYANRGYYNSPYLNYGAGYQRYGYGYQPYSVPSYGIPGSYQTRNGLGYQPTLSIQPNSVYPSSAAAAALEQSRLQALQQSLNQSQRSTTETSVRLLNNLIPTNSAAHPIQTLAERAFKEARYSDAVGYADRAIALDRDNGQLMLFSSQAKLAVGDYSNAFLEVEAATRRLPQEQWASVVSNYPKIYGKDDYVGQIDRLSQYIAVNPARYLARALRGFHYGCLGYQDAALKDLNAAMQTNPGDEAVSRLVAGFSPKGIPAPAINKPVLQAPIDASQIDGPPAESVLEVSPDDVVPSVVPSSNSIFEDDSSGALDS